MTDDGKEIPNHLIKSFQQFEILCQTTLQFT